VVLLGGGGGSPLSTGAVDDLQKQRRQLTGSRTPRRRPKTRFGQKFESARNKDRWIEKLKELQEKRRIQQELAQHIGKERSTIANSLRLLKLPRHMQGAIESRNITPGHARAILSLIDNTDQETLYKEIVKQGLSVRAAEALADKLNRGIRKGEDSTKDKKPLSERRKSVELLSLEQKFIECLGTRVTIKGSDKRGKIQIDYFSLDDLERIYLLIVKEE